MRNFVLPFVGIVLVAVLFTVLFRSTFRTDSVKADINQSLGLRIASSDGDVTTLNLYTIFPENNLTDINVASVVLTYPSAEIEVLGFESPDGFLGIDANIDNVLGRSSIDIARISDPFVNDQTCLYIRVRPKTENTNLDWLSTISTGESTLGVTYEPIVNIPTTSQSSSSFESNSSDSSSTDSASSSGISSSIGSNTEQDFSDKVPATSTESSLVFFNDRLYEFSLRERSIWWRSSISSLVNFDGDDNRENWQLLFSNITSVPISATVFKDRLNLAIVDNKNIVRNNSMDASGSWSGWTGNTSGKSSLKVGTAGFTPAGSDTEYLYQVIRGRTSNFVYVRRSSDGVFDDGEDEKWVQVPGKTPADISFFTHQGRLFWSMRGQTNNSLWLASTADGKFDRSDSSELEIRLTIQSKFSPASISDGNRIRTFVSGVDEKLYYADSTDLGLSWTTWTIKDDLTSTRALTSILLGERIFLSLRQVDGFVYLIGYRK